jgi:hypothetical protein
MAFPEHFIFTVTTGRSGQNSLADYLARAVPDSYVACEEPQPKLMFAKYSGFLGGLENRFRRRFVETHELLGRGQVLKAFDQGDEAYLDAIVERRLRKIQKRGSRIYIDVSKYFSRGLHRAFCRAVGDFGLILLIRDPLANMRSFLNRDKKFTLDNALPDARSNELVLDSSNMTKGELYLWSWCENFLRYLKLIEEFGVKRHVIVRTEDIHDPARLNSYLGTLGLASIVAGPPPLLNTNSLRTIVTEEDIRTFEKFRKRLSSEVVERIAMLREYDPSASLGVMP